MRKIMLIGMAMLTTGITFVSCSNASDVLEKNKDIFIEDQLNVYRTNFERRYGKVDPNQKWDFTSMANGAKTRGNEGTDVSSVIDYPGVYQKSLHADKAPLKKLLVDGETVEGAVAVVKDWNPNVNVNMYAAFCHDASRKNNYYHLIVNYNGEQNVKTVQIKNGAWWDSNATCPSNKGVSVNTMSLSSSTTWTMVYSKKQKLNQGVISSKTITSFTEVKVNNRTYWCFDCDGDGQYSDLIFLVSDNTNNKKRYFVEDLGSKDDFDFNDIVVDVEQFADGTQKAIIRAMGGTIDFTLKIGNTTWTKSVEGVAAGYDVATMYNTQGTKVEKLAEFTVTGWNPATNNISVSVASQTQNNVIIELPFPKQGEIPLIIAVDTFVEWMGERQSLPDDWYYILDDDVFVDPEE